MCSRLLAGMMTAMLLLTAAPAISAAQELDLTKKGALELKMQDQNGQRVPGAEISLYQVGKAEIRDGTLCFSETEDFSGHSLAHLNDPALPGAFLEDAERQNLEPLQTAVSSSDGRAIFSDLSAGLYLVKLSGSAKGDSRTYTMKPFLVSVPMMNEENTGWQYAVEAVPKLMSLDRPVVDVTVKKQWAEDDPTHRPDSITAELWGGGQCADTVELTKENDWTHVFRDLDPSIDWSVREQKIPQGYGVSYREDSRTHTLLIINTGIHDGPGGLIQTGQLNWPVPILAGGGLCLIFAGAVMNRGKKKEK